MKIWNKNMTKSIITQNRLKKPLNPLLNFICEKLRLEIRFKEKSKKQSHQFEITLSSFTIVLHVRPNCHFWHGQFGTWMESGSGRTVYCDPSHEAMGMSAICEGNGSHSLKQNWYSLRQWFPEFDYRYFNSSYLSLLNELKFN